MFQSQAMEEKMSCYETGISKLYSNRALREVPKENAMRTPTY